MKEDIVKKISRYLTWFYVTCIGHAGVLRFVINSFSFRKRFDIQIFFGRHTRVIHIWPTTMPSVYDVIILFYDIIWRCRNHRKYFLRHLHKNNRDVLHCRIVHRATLARCKLSTYIVACFCQWQTPPIDPVTFSIGIIPGAFGKWIANFAWHWPVQSPSGQIFTRILCSSWIFQEISSEFSETYRNISRWKDEKKNEISRKIHPRVHQGSHSRPL